MLSASGMATQCVNNPTMSNSPPSSSSDATSITSPSPPDEWADLKLAIGKSKLYCGFVAIAGAGGDDTNVGTRAADDFNYTPPAQNWYYILARCPFNGTIYMKKSNDDRVAHNDL